jgi:murein L,D-transpeptidase YcbB/YkuD
MKPIGTCLAVLMIALVACVGGSSDGGDDGHDRVFAEAVAPEIEAALAEGGPPGTAETPLEDAVARLYAGRAHSPVWIGRSGPTPRGQTLAEVLRGASRGGLDPAAYGSRDLLPRMASSAPVEGEGAEAAAARLDVALTRALARLARDLGSGRVAPEAAGLHWQTRRPEVDLDAVLATAAAGDGPAAALDAVRPPHDQVARLEEALSRYRQVAADGGWPRIAEGDPLQAGEEDPHRVVALRQRLAAEGYAADGEAGGAPSPVYDDGLAEAVREYQRRRGLADDGVVGGRTLEELNVPAAHRARQIEANLVRWRWVPADLGSRYVLVNVPRFELEVHDGDQEVRRMKVVVGEELNATPMFSDRMQYLVFNPYWNVPASIVAEEILPALEADPDHLADHQMEVIQGWEQDATVLGPHALAEARQAADEGSGFRIRQRPGAENPLGRVKFIFPNEHAIYLHDTPADHLFDKTVRTLSHGCIRVEEPVALASWVLGEPEAAIRQRIAGDEDQWVDVPREIPVHILYFTVAVDDDGRVLFFDDFYGIDERVLQAVDAAGPEPPSPRG